MLKKRANICWFTTMIAAISLFSWSLVFAQPAKHYFPSELTSFSDGYEDYIDSRDFTSEFYYDLRTNKHDFIQFASGKKTFIFDPAQLRWYAYGANGSLVGSGRASGGRNYCPDVKRRCRTPVGTFNVTRKGSASCVSSKFPIGRGGAPMPYCMFFRGGYAIHGSPDVPNYNASHGCIRVEPSAARWLSHNFMDHGTTVIVRPYK